MAARLGATGAEALAVVDAAGHLLGIVTAAALLAAVGRDGAAACRARDLLVTPATAGADATVAECVLALAASGTDAVAITEGGSPTGVLHALVTPRDLVPTFGEQPVALLRELQRAPSPEALGAVNGRFRSFLLDQLAAPSSVDWLTALARRFDETLFARLVALTGAPAGEDCSWFFFGATARGEAMNAQALQVGLVYDDASPQRAQALLDWHARLCAAFPECGYVRSESSAGPDSAYRCGSRREWEDRFRGWVRDPVANALYKARPLFDLRPVLGSPRWFPPLEAAVREEVARQETFLFVLANDCLANLPPLSFFRDLVVEESGEQNAVFQLERSALRPLVDVARVFAIAGGRGLGSSTLERLELGRQHAPAEEKVFREATDTTRLLLFHQARAALRHSGSGAEIPPASLSRHDRQALKAGFRSILRLLELASAREWRGR
jgi:CBS domain-containing protein